MAELTNISDYYWYRTKLFFVDSENNETTEIPQDNIRSILIDRNYEDLNQPVLILSVSLDRKLLNRIIESQEDSLMSFTIYKVNENNPDYIGDKVVEDLFIYIVIWRYNQYCALAFIRNGVLEKQSCLWSCIRHSDHRCISLTYYVLTYVGALTSYITK